MPTKKYQPKKAGKPYKEKNKTWLKDDRDLQFYNSAVWRKLSIAYKTRNPVCEIDGCTQPSYYTDHIKPVSEGGSKLNESNLQALCKSCNASKTAKQVKRGKY